MAVTARTRQARAQSRSGAAERMRRYRARKRATGFTQVRRWVAVDDDAGATYSDHRILDARSLALHCLIARKISRDPALLDIARRNVTAWMARYAGNEAPRCLLEWGRILRRPWPAVAALITSPSEVATRLRQSSPFAGVLDPHERKRIYEAFRA